MNVVTYYKINDILTEWDPINVGLPISKDEYIGFIPKIYNAYCKDINLKEVLITIMEDDLSLSINPDDCRFNENLDMIIRKLQKSLN